jgi:hypothetical protein
MATPELLACSNPTALLVRAARPPLLHLRSSVAVSAVPYGCAGFNVGAEFKVPVVKIADWFDRFPFGQNGVEYIEHVKVSAWFLKC